MDVFDTTTGQDVHTSEVSLSFSQYVLGTPNSAYLDAALWPNLLGARQGSRVPPGFGGRRPTTAMLMSGQTSGDAAFHPLLFVRYRG